MGPTNLIFHTLSFVLYSVYMFLVSVCVSASRCSSCGSLAGAAFAGACTGLWVPIAPAFWPLLVRFKGPQCHSFSAIWIKYYTTSWGEAAVRVVNVRDARLQQMKTKAVTKIICRVGTMDSVWPSPFSNYVFSTVNWFRISEATNRPLKAWMQIPSVR